MARKRGRRWISRAAVLGVALASSACDKEYFPRSPHEAVRPGLRLRVDALTLEPMMTVRMSVYGIGQTGVRRVLLVPAAAEPCREGVRETEAKLDGQRIWARPFALQGSHELVLRYGPGVSWELTASPVALDFVLTSPAGPDECLRVVVTGTDPSLAWQRDIVGSTGSAIRIVAPLHSVDGIGAGWSVDARIGAYAGPLRLAGELGLGGAHCDYNCYNSGVGFLWLPLSASADWVAWQSKGSIVDLGLAYRLYPASISYRDSGRFAFAHGPELRLVFGGAAQRGPGLQDGPRIASAGYELFAAEWFGHGANGAEHTFVLGLGIIGDAGF